MNEDRRNRIAELVAEKKAVTNAEIMARFGISIETVRRDLAYLESKGLIERVYGGAAARVFRREEPTYFRREHTREAEKSAIAAVAAGMTGACKNVFFDIGTTVERIARLVDDLSMNAFTNSMRTAIMLSEKGCAVTVPGGNMRPVEFSVSGVLAENNMDLFNVDLAFIGAAGMDETGVTDFIPDEAHFRSRVIEHASRVIVAADSSKCAVRALCRVCSWSDVDMLITDAGAPKPLLSVIADKGVEIVIAK